jgi:hypothetical protein
MRPLASRDEGAEVKRSQERRRQVRGLLWIAVAAVVFSVWRAGVHGVFPVGWWRLW